MLLQCYYATSYFFSMLPRYLKGTLFLFTFDHTSLLFTNLLARPHTMQHGRHHMTVADLVGRKFEVVEELVGRMIEVVVDTLDHYLPDLLQFVGGSAD